MGAGEVGVGAAGFLEFNDADGHAVAVEHDVEAPFVVALHQGDLAEQPDGRVGFVAF